MTAMLLPSITSDVAAAPSEDSARRQVTLLSGFLGSGKTTLLRAELAHVGAEAPSVVLNDFAATAVDDTLLDAGRDGPTVILGGCACCTRRDDLAAALMQLLDAEQRGDGAHRKRVVIETSGLSDPDPIAFTIANHPVLQHHYSLTRVCVTVDAMNGAHTLEHHEVALRQLLAADEIFVTKADLAAPEDLSRIVGRLQQMNPSAKLSVTAHGDVLNVLPPSLATPAHVSPRQATGSSHIANISTLELVTDEALDWQAFSVWLSLLLHEHGPDILRVKGILDVANIGPIAINGVQHVVHRPEHVVHPVPPGTRLVIIARGIDAQSLDRSFRAFVGTR